MLGNIIGHVSAYRNGQNLSDTHNVSHNLNDAIRHLAFQVKAFGLGSEISYIFIDGFNCTVTDTLIRELSLRPTLSTVRNRRVCGRPNFFSDVSVLSYPKTNAVRYRLIHCNAVYNADCCQ